MAAYACPEPVLGPVQEVAMKGMPCVDMDQLKPVHCAEFQAGAQFALEHLSTAPLLTPISTSFIIPALTPAIPVILAPVKSEARLDTGTDPPYLQTLRIRI